MVGFLRRSPLNARRTLLLVNPASDFPTYFGAEVFAARGLQPVTRIADLALPTLAALAAPHLDVVMCDEMIEPVPYGGAPDYVGITGKVSQRGRMLAIAHEFRRRGVTVIIGGPYASLDPEALRPHCDILVRGEVEAIAGQLFADLAAGTWRDEYIGSAVDLAISPIPAWHGYRNDRALIGCVQTSRGCPFECEFCDVIQYLGRKQRHKPPRAVVAELELLHRLGYRRVFLADDNLTVHRRRAKELLDELRLWNAKNGADRMSFITQVSIDAVRDDELLAMCAEAGLTHVYVGLETPNKESLREAHKRQNLHGDLVEEVERFYAHGISVTAGLIVGFDADDAGIFERQYDFAMATGIPIFSLGALVAPVATPLHARMAAAGRLEGDSPEMAALPWMTNIIPAKMSREELLSGLRWLCNKLYDPAAFGERVIRQMDLLPPAGRAPAGSPRHTRKEPRPTADTLKLLRSLSQLGEPEAEMWTRIRKHLSTRPDLTSHVIPVVLQYLQVRHMYDHAGLWARS